MKKAISTDLTQTNITSVLSILTEMPQKLEQLLSELSSEQRNRPLAEGERTFTEVLAHLINCEERNSETIYLALLRDEPLVPDLHAERDWGKLLRHDLFESSDLIDYFKLRRMVVTACPQDAHRGAVGACDT